MVVEPVAAGDGGDGFQGGGEDAIGLLVLVLVLAAALALEAGADGVPAAVGLEGFRTVGFPFADPCTDHGVVQAHQPGDLLAVVALLEQFDGPHPLFERVLAVRLLSLSPTCRHLAINSKEYPSPTACK